MESRIGTVKEEPDDWLMTIVPLGDLILDISDEGGRESFSYRVEAERLRQASPYFQRLLGGTYSEGANVIAAHNDLRVRYHDIGEAVVEELPHVSIIDIGRTSKVNTIKNITADFLRALHGLDLGISAPPLQNMANLAIVADRFDALEYFTKYVRRKKFLQTIDAKTKARAGTNISEEKIRQRLLVGILLDHSPWVTMYSRRLILGGSVKWNDQSVDNSGEALWWDLPIGIEDELIFRRDCILETIKSLQTHFLKLYTSGERQCKLGYDSSTQCDSFQLGEMIRFFSRNGTLRLQSTIFDEEMPQQYTGDIDCLIDTLRQCASYQIDVNHRHCGLRSRLIPLLDLIQNQLNLDAGSLDTGICADCWQHNKAEYAWSEAKRPLTWTRARLQASRRQARDSHSGNSCFARHLSVRDMFTAVERDWTARDGY